MPEIEKAIDEAVHKLDGILKEAEKKQEQLLDEDNLRDALTDLFEGNVGPPLAELEHEESKKEAEQRFRRRIPPGYKDSEKEGDEKYGDVVLWHQLIKHGKSTKRPLIFVTADEKEDWWLKQGHRTMGPRPELIKEMTSKANVGFYMYSPDRFMEISEAELKLTVGDAVKEVREIRQRDVALGRAIEVEERRRRVMEMAAELVRERAVGRDAARRMAEMLQEREQVLLPELLRGSIRLSDFLGLGDPPILRYIVELASERHKDEARPEAENPREREQEGDEMKGGG